jgi:hypothetical protein
MPAKDRKKSCYPKGTGLGRDTQENGRDIAPGTAKTRQNGGEALRFHIEGEAKIQSAKTVFENVLLINDLRALPVSGGLSVKLKNQIAGIG